MKSKYVCNGLISLHIEFHDNRTKWTENSNIKICRWGETEKEPMKCYDITVLGGSVGWNYTDGGVEMRPCSEFVLWVNTRSRCGNQLGELWSLRGQWDAAYTGKNCMISFLHKFLV